MMGSTLCPKRREEDDGEYSLSEAEDGVTETAAENERGYLPVRVRDTLTVWDVWSRPSPNSSLETCCATTKRKDTPKMGWGRRREYPGT